MGMFVLVRHVHAGGEEELARPDADRPLSILGYWQARSLVAALNGIIVNLDWHDNYIRCPEHSVKCVLLCHEIG